MNIKTIVKDWYKELFWMAVGAGVALAAKKGIDYILEKRAEKQQDERIDEMRHTLEELKNATADIVEKEFLPVEKPSEPVKDLKVANADKPNLEEFVKKLSEDKKIEVISEDEFNAAPIDVRIECAYDAQTGLWHCLGQNDYEDAEEEDYDMAMFLGERIVHLVMFRLPLNTPVYFKRGIQYIMVEIYDTKGGKK